MDTENDFPTLLHFHKSLALKFQGQGLSQNQGQGQVLGLHYQGQGQGLTSLIFPVQRVAWRVSGGVMGAARKIILFKRYW